LPDPRELPQEVTIRVFGPDGRPVSYAYLDVIADHGAGGGDVLRGGAKDFKIGPGSSSFRVVVTSAKDAAGEDLGPGVFGPFPADSGQVEIRLPADTAIEGVVLGSDGRPAGGVEVRARPVSHQIYRNASDLEVEARTDAQGRFRLGGLGAWSYRVQVVQPDGCARVPGLEVRSGTSDVLFSLPRGRTVLIKVLSDQGAPLAHARVFAQDENERTASAHSDARGEARLVGLADGQRHTLEVTPPSQHPELSRHKVVGWIPKDTVIRLDRSGSVRGVVLGPSGEPVADVWVWRRARNGKWYAVGEVSDDGTFVLKELEKGTVALRATPIGGNWSEDGVEEVVVEAGAEGVVLRTDPGLRLVVHIKNLPAGRSGTADLTSETRPGIVRRNVSTKRGFRAFHGLKPGDTWTLRIVGAGDHALRQVGIRSDADRVEVKLAPGVTIRGRVIEPPGAHGVAVSAIAGKVSARGTVDADGRFEVEGLVEGRWLVRGYARVGNDLWAAEAEVETGTDVEIRLKRKKPR